VGVCVCEIDGSYIEGGGLLNNLYLLNNVPILKNRRFFQSLFYVMMIEGYHHYSP